MKYIYTKVRLLTQKYIVLLISALWALQQRENTHRELLHNTATRALAATQKQAGLTTRSLRDRFANFYNVRRPLRKPSHAAKQIKTMTFQFTFIRLKLSIIRQELTNMMPKGLCLSQKYILSCIKWNAKIPVNSNENFGFFLLLVRSNSTLLPREAFSCSGKLLLF